MAAKKKTKKKSGIFSRIFQGRLLSYTFFSRYGMLVCGVAVFCIVITASRFHTMIQKSKILELKNEINYNRSELVKAKSEYNFRVREKYITEAVDSLGLGLIMPEAPSYQLK